MSYVIFAGYTLIFPQPIQRIGNLCFFIYHFYEPTQFHILEQAAKWLAKITDWDHFGWYALDVEGIAIFMTFAQKSAEERPHLEQLQYNLQDRQVSFVQSHNK